MQLARPAIAIDPRLFGRGRPKLHDCAAPHIRTGDDLKLFATTFVGGFVFVSLLIA